MSVSSSSSFKERVAHIRKGLDNAPLRSSSTATAGDHLGGNSARGSNPSAQFSAAIAQEHRLAALLDTISSLEDKLSSESNAREITSQRCVNLVNGRIEEAMQSLEARYYNRVTSLSNAVDSMGSRIAELERELAAERDKNAMLTRELMQRNTDDIAEIKESLRREQVGRDSSLRELSQRVSSALDELTDQIEAESSSRKGTHSEFRELIREATETRSSSDKRLLARVQAELGKLAVAIDTEREQRETGEESLASTLEAIVKSL